MYSCTCLSLQPQVDCDQGPLQKKEGGPAGKLEKAWLGRDWRTRKGASKNHLGRVERLQEAVMGSQVAGRSWGAGREVFVVRAESGILTYLSLRCSLASNCPLSDPSFYGPQFQPPTCSDCNILRPFPYPVMHSGYCPFSSQVRLQSCPPSSLSN